MNGEERRGSSEVASRFRDRLAELKRNGCNVLLVGTDAIDSACHRLLGESSAGPRYRLFVTTDAGLETARARLTSARQGPYSDAAAVVNWDVGVRGPASTGPGDSGGPVDDGPVVRNSNGPPFREVPVGGGSDELGAAIEETIEHFETEHGTLSPAELRVCFDSLTPLVADYEYEDARRVLLDLFETVDRVDGMAHYHLPGEYDSEQVETFAPLFDAVLAVRRSDGTVEQRWFLTESGTKTDWLAL